MRLVLANHSFVHAAGTEVYLLTVAEHFQRLGHDVSIYAREVGPFSEHARDRGVRVHGELHELPADCDALLTQDAVVAYDCGALPGCAAHFPSLRRRIQPLGAATAGRHRGYVPCPQRSL